MSIAGIVKYSLLSLFVILLSAFRWDLMFGELDWDTVNAEIADEYPTVPGMGIEELKYRLEHGTPIHLIDVRSDEEYRISHLPGAVLFTSWRTETVRKDATIVVYCSVGLRSAKFAKELQGQGFEQVYNLDGSIFMWANSGYSLVAGEGEVSRVHPYNRRWGRLLDESLHIDGKGGTK